MPVPHQPTKVRWAPTDPRAAPAAVGPTGQIGRPPGRRRCPVRRQGPLAMGGRQTRKGRRRLYQHPEDGPDPHQAAFRRLPAPRRMGHAGQARRQPIRLGQQRRLFPHDYELQIIESHDHQIYADGIAGAIYSQTPPLVNASRKPGQWETYDVVFRPPASTASGCCSPAILPSSGTACSCRTTRPRCVPPAPRPENQLQRPRHDRAHHAPISQLGSPLPQHLGPAVESR